MDEKRNKYILRGDIGLLNALIGHSNYEKGRFESRISSNDYVDLDYAKKRVKELEKEIEEMEEERDNLIDILVERIN